MKTVAVALLLVATSAFAGDVLKRGAAIAPETRVVALEKVLDAPDDYTKDAVVVEGLVEASCQNKGCWMQIKPEEGEDGVRVTFKDYGFFVPLDSAGRTAKVEGVVKLAELSDQRAKHYESEGALVPRDASGKAREVQLLATGVELRR